MKNDNVCFSGGAIGADHEFTLAARKAGHKVINYSFTGHKSRDEVVILNAFRLIQADPYLCEANSYIKRRYPTMSDHTNNLLRRNYYQIVDTKRIYAVASLGERGVPAGGTAWAVVMGIIRKVPEIYLFDQEKQIWLQFGCINKDRSFQWYGESLLSPVHLPKPIGLYTGIGSRDLSEVGKLAIHSLYK